MWTPDRLHGEVRLLPDSRRLHLFVSETGVCLAGERAQSAVPRYRRNVWTEAQRKIYKESNPPLNGGMNILEGFYVDIFPVFKIS
jgi:hypothetical protein